MIIAALTLGRHGYIMTSNWSRPFDDPIPLPRGRQLVTLKDAANFIQKLPKAEQDLEEWQAAVEVLLLVELNGPTMMAHRCHEGIEPRPRSEAKARYLMTDPKKDACKPTHNKLGRSKQSLEARQRVVEEYVMDLREILKKLRKIFN